MVHRDPPGASYAQYMVSPYPPTALPSFMHNLTLVRLQGSQVRAHELYLCEQSRLALPSRRKGAFAHLREIDAANLP